MNLTVTELIVDGVALPTPKLEGVKITKNKIWSSNTGRLESTGEMVGTIVAQKTKLEIEWPPLSMEDIAIIEAAVSSSAAFHSLQFTDMAGVTRALSVYFGDPEYTIYSYSEGVQRVNDAKVSAIEQ